MIKTVYVAGTWDLFHPGHVNILKTAQEFGRVVVAVSTDELVKKKKGTYPVMSLKERMDVIRSCKYVDSVVVQSSILDKEQLVFYRADIIMVGSDWIGKKNDGIEWMKEHGSVIFIPYTKGVSTTEIKQRIQGK